MNEKLSTQGIQVSGSDFMLVSGNSMSDVECGVAGYRPYAEDNE